MDAILAQKIQIEISKEVASRLFRFEIRLVDENSFLEHFGWKMPSRSVTVKRCDIGKGFELWRVSYESWTGSMNEVLSNEYTGIYFPLLWFHLNDFEF